MGPDLFELYEDGQADDEVAAIIRLGHFEHLPPHVRVVTQFADIITVRLTRRDLPAVSGASEVAGMIAGDSLLGPDVELAVEGSAELSVETVLATDQRRPSGEKATGRGVVVGVVDWGFDFAHPDFRHPDGTSRILALWDQRGGKRAGSPQPFGYGVVHDTAAINRALKAPDPYAALSYHPADADTGIGCHGTHVTSIAAGSGGEGRPCGIAPEADLVLVHNTPWDDAESDRLGDSVTLLEGIDFIARTAGKRPWAVNLSMGCHADQHDGSTLVELGLDAVVRAEPGRAVCMSAGNYFNKRIHASGRLKPTEERSFAWTINDPKPSDYNQLQIWYSWQDKLELVLKAPDGTVTARARIGERSKLMNGTVELGNVYHRGQEPNSLDNHVTVFLYKEAPPGEWTATLVGSDVIDGRYHAWIEREVACPPCQSRFVTEDADPKFTTGTICNGRRTLAVGAYDRHDPEEKLGPFSSVGPTRDDRLKPDLCAPGVAVLAARSAPRAGAGTAPPLTRMSGTSMAAPHVTGTVALMFQAAPRPLRIEETHNLLLASARRVDVPEPIPERIGIGFLDVADAVDAARQVGRSPGSFAQQVVQVPARAAPKAAPRTIGQAETLDAAGPSPATLPACTCGTALARARDTADTADTAETAETAAAAVPGPCPDVAAVHRELSLGAVDPAVREAQRRLNAFHALQTAAGLRGLPQGPIGTDCIFGPRTAAAVKAFQQLTFPGQPRAVDGIIGPQTWAHLELVPLTPPAVIPDPPPPVPVPVPVPPTLAPCGTLQVWINAFIPGSVPGYTLTIPAGPHAGETAIPCPSVALPVNPRCLSRGYLTDQRTFDPSPTASRRMQSKVEISLVPPLLIAHPGAEHTTSGTTEIDKATGAVTCVKPADMSRCGFTNFRVQPDPSAPLSGNFFIRVDVSGAASDPCVNLAADIDYHGTISVFCAPRSNWVEVSFDGQIDSFPAFEMYARLGGVTKTLFRAPPPPGSTVVSLLGAANAPVTGRVTFAGCRLTAAVAASSDAETAPARLARRAETMVAESVTTAGPLQRDGQPLTHTVFGDALKQAGARPMAAAWEVFDAMVYPGRDALRRQINEQFEVVGAAGARPRAALQAGDVLLRRTDSRQGHVAVLGASELLPSAQLTSRGWTPEAAGRGGYAHVVEGGRLPHPQADGFARQITDEAGYVLPNQIVLRPRSADATERVDPLSLVVGLDLGSVLNRPPSPTVLVVPEPHDPAGETAPDADAAISPFPATPFADLDRDPAGGKLSRALEDALASVAADQAANRDFQGLLDVNQRPLDVRDIPLAVVSFNLDGTTTAVGRHDTLMYYSGSLLKIAAMYAAFQLRHAVNELAATLPLNLTLPQFFARLHGAFDPPIRGAVRLLTDQNFHQTPHYELLFTPSADATGRFTVDFRRDPQNARVDFFGHLREMVVNSHNPSAGFCIQALGYNYINGVLERAGLFRPDRAARNGNGIWLAGDYMPGAIDSNSSYPDDREMLALGLRGGPVVSIDSVNDRQVKQVTTCIDAARLFVLLANDELVSTAHGQPNAEMLALLKQAVHSSGAPSRLAEKASPTPRFDVLHCKIGLGELKGGMCPSHRCVSSELSIVQHASGRQFVTIFQNLNEATSLHFHLIAEILQRTMDNFLLRQP